MEEWMRYAHGGTREKQHALRITATWYCNFVLRALWTGNTETELCALQ
jgi:hypothetical protein